MIFTNAGKAIMLDAISNVTASLHTADPGAAGTLNEVSGGGYARKGITFAAATSGNRNATTLPTFDVPAGTTITHAAFWSGTTFIATGTLAIPEAYGGNGKYTLTDADLTLLDS
ncbi:hypothetical protein IT774_05215 [Salinimonas marina]|uniref:Uncharacterized protein n=1 Tax=Salinimonas marina TaxID=2785918 RepID=A0A7S9HDW2_9ALTE|nr:hypothetical protein [Salinimonas marina]QPG06574.1 hypothetical protein IT774_05215 [Salinimonas marina]